MKKIAYYLSSSALLAFPMLVGAQGFTADGGQIGVLLGNLLQFFNNVLIPFILGLGFLLFVWGMFQFFIAGGADEAKRESGKQLMLYATLGFVIIIIFWGIINLITTSTGFQNQGLQNLPKAVVPAP